jgi:DNA-binding NtrC family response regulator
VANITETESRHLAGHHERDDHPIVTVVAHPDSGLIGVRQPLPTGRVVVGRTSTALLPSVFDHRKVSRDHACFCTAARTTVEDLGSRNGTFVNDRAAAEAQPLEAGDVVRIGGIALLFHRGPRSYPEPRHPSLWGSSAAMARLLNDIREAAEGDSSVMILGETGTGKELVAAALHEASGRSGALVPVNCGGMSEGVIQSELFGHTRGAFSGAVAARPGLVTEAAGGTLFLDEIGAAPAALQTTLLRLLENGEYRVMGSNELCQAKVRFVAATQPDVAQSVDEGGFRADLWYRLARRVVVVPSLRERREDIVVLAHRFAEPYGRRVSFSAELATALVRHDWPGNVRELQAVVERLIKGAQGEELAVPSWLVPQRKKSAQRPDASAPNPSAGSTPTPRPSREALEATLRRCGGRVAPAARDFGVDRKTLYRWIETLGVDLAALRS